MGKDLTLYDDNTREVLVEKIERHCYDVKSNFGYDGSSGLCLKQCMMRDDDEIMIGSATCTSCIYNKGFDDDKYYIICSRLTKALGK